VLHPELLVSVAADHPDVTVINVEPYLLEDVDGSLQPVLTNDQLTPTQATNEWQLPTEPWVFVVDRDGIVTASFMLTVLLRRQEPRLFSRTGPRPSPRNCATKAKASAGT